MRGYHSFDGAACLYRVRKRAQIRCLQPPTTPRKLAKTGRGLTDSMATNKLAGNEPSHISRAPPTAVHRSWLFAHARCLPEYLIKKSIGVPIKGQIWARREWP
jgi:hypothetical protein